MRATLKDIGRGAAGVAILAALMALPLMFLGGGIWAAERFLPVLFTLSWIALAIVAFILVPLAFFRRTRGLAGALIFGSSFLFGLSLWLWGLLVTFIVWGWVGVLVGIFLMGVGVVPIGMLAMLVEGEWSLLVQMIVLAVVVFLTRAGGGVVAERAREQARSASDPSPASRTDTL